MASPSFSRRCGSHRAFSSGIQLAGWGLRREHGAEQVG